MAVRPERWILGVLALLIFGVGWAVRLEQLPERVLHSDEGVQAFQTWRLLDTGVYDYSPEDRHGPVLYFFSAGVMKVLGVGPAELDALDLRAVSMGAGLALLAAVLALGWWWRLPALIWGGAFLALSPFAILYQNYYTQESLFATLSLALVGLAALSRVRLSIGLAGAIGALAGCLLATKETAAIHFVALGLAWLAVGWKDGWRGAWTLPRVAASLVAAGLAWVLFMSQGLRDWGAVGEGLASFFHYAERSQGQGHEKPWSYYLGLFWPRLQGGVWWSQVGVLAGGLLGAGLAWKGRAAGPLGRGLALLAVFSWSLWLLYSLIPYKTPWLMLTPVAGFCLLSGVAAAWLQGRRPLPLGVAMAGLFALLLAIEATRLWRPALFRYADDPRNPFLYTHTNPGFSRLLRRLEELHQRFPEADLAVVQPDYAWPLPWHLRYWEEVGYFPAWPERAEAFDLLVIDARLLEGTHPPTLDGYVVEAHGLRTNVLLFLYIREPIWEVFLADDGASDPED